MSNSTAAFSGQGGAASSTAAAIDSLRKIRKRVPEQFDSQLIDDSFSQAHCLHLADLDGDGKPELITGKRVHAHNGRDPGADQLPQMRYYVWNAQEKSFDAHTINRGEVGTGLQIRTADLDGDGDTDLVVAGKEGTQILFSQRISK